MVKQKGILNGHPIVEDSAAPGVPLTNLAEDGGDIVAANAAWIAQTGISAAADTATNTANILTNTNDISQNTSDIADNTANISTNSGLIATNISDIAANLASINLMRTPYVFTGVPDYDTAKTDNVAALSADVAAAMSAGRPLLIPSGRYWMSTSINFANTDDIVIIAEPGAEFIWDGSGVGILFTGGFDTTTTLATTNRTRGEYVIDTAAAHGAAIGDMVLIQGSEVPDTGFGYTTAHASIVTAIPTTTQLKIAHPLNFNFFIGDSVKVTKNRGRVYISGLRFDSTPSSQVTHNLLYCRQINGVMIERCTFITSNPGGQCDAVNWLESHSCRMNNCRIDNVRYGVLINRCRNIGGKDNECNDARHCFTPSWFTDGVFVDGLWGERAEGLIDAHYAFNLIYRNVVNLGADSVNTMNVRGLGVTLENVQYQNRNLGGLAIYITPAGMNAGAYPLLAHEYDISIKNCDLDIGSQEVRVYSARHLTIENTDLNGATLQVGGNETNNKVLDWDFKGLHNVTAMSGDLVGPRIYRPYRDKTTKERHTQDASYTEHTGTADGGTTGQIDTGDNFGTADGDLVGYLVEITVNGSGTGTPVGEYRVIDGWTASTNIATVSTAFTVAPDTQNQYRISQYGLDTRFDPDWEITGGWSMIRGRLFGFETDDGDPPRPRRIRIYDTGGQRFGIAARRYFVCEFNLHHVYNPGTAPAHDKWKWIWSHKNPASVSIRGPEFFERSGLDADLNKLYQIDIEDVVIDTVSTSDWVEFTLAFGSEISNHAAWYELNMWGVGIV